MTDTCSELEYPKFEQARLRHMSLDNSGPQAEVKADNAICRPANSKDIKTVNIIADFESADNQKVSAEVEQIEIRDSMISTVVPQGYYLPESYPNPCNTETKMGCYLPDSCRAGYSVYNLLGHIVNTTAEGELSSGEQFTDRDDRNIGKTDIPAVRTFAGLTASRPILSGEWYS